MFIVLIYYRIDGRFVVPGGHVQLTGSADGQSPLQDVKAPVAAAKRGVIAIGPRSQHFCLELLRIKATPACIVNAVGDVERLDVKKRRAVIIREHGLTQSGLGIASDANFLQTGATLEGGIADGLDASADIDRLQRCVGHESSTADGLH